MAKAKSSPAAKEQCSITLTIGKDVYRGAGPTPTEALGALKRPAKIMSKGTVSVSMGSAVKSMLLQPVKIKRLFYNSRGVQDIIAKQLFALMK